MMTKSPEIVALIPARGGSKAIPRKNLLQLLGKPLIAHSIEQAAASARITRTIVSTDDEEIAEVARRFGAEVPFMRPAEFAQDHSPDLDVFRHCLQWMEREEGRLPELVVHLRPTGPARRVELIDAAIDRLLAAPDADALRSISLAQQTPYKMWLVDDDGVIEPVVRLPGIPEAHSMARQTLPKAYWQNGYVDIVRPRAVLEMNSMVGRHTLGFTINLQVHDIDYRDDVALVEREILRLRSGEEEDGHHGAAEDKVPV